MDGILKCSGIYQIKNLVNGKLYIGSTEVLGRRWSTHLQRLRKNRHHSWKLQKDFNTYGEAEFEFTPLFICSEKDLCFYEQRALGTFDTVNQGYNVSAHAEAPMKGRNHSEETKTKISEALHGNQYARGSKGRLGQTNSKEHREKLSLAHTGKKRDPEQVKKTADALRGRPGSPHSEETKAHLSEVHKIIQSQRTKHPMTGKQHSEETKLRMSQAHTGRPKSAETRARMSQSWVKRKAKSAEELENKKIK